MEIERCYEILELRPGASPGEIRHSYKDIVAVWHPDRFKHNPRLRRKAEQKLKEVNIAYETLLNLIKSEKLSDRRTATSGKERPRQKKDPGKTATVEDVAAVGTFYALKIWADFSLALKQFMGNRISDERTGSNHDDK